MNLGGGEGGNRRLRYTLETLLSTLGLPYRFADSPLGSATCATERCLHLVVGPSGDAAALTPTLSPWERESHHPSLTTHRSSLIAHHPSLAAVFSQLAREEEYSLSVRDRHGRFLWEHSGLSGPFGESSQRGAGACPLPHDKKDLADAPLGQQGAGARPLVSEYCRSLLDSLRQAFAEAGLPMIRKEPWPYAKPMAACLTHDVDAVRRGKLARGVAVRDVTGVLSSLARGKVGRAAAGVASIARTAARGEDPYWTFNRISALESEHGYRSTYFFMAGRLHPEDASYGLEDSRISRLLGELRSRGCEIGLHGSYASSTDGESLRQQRRRLEKAAGVPVAGHRNHLLRFQAPDSWKAQAAAGFSYDSTLGFADREGFRGGHAFPFHPFDLASQERLELLELPLAFMEVTLHKYRRLRGEEASEALRELLREVLSAGGLATLLWHNDTFYEPEYPDCARLYGEALAWLSCHGAHVATCGEIDRWWRAREAVTFSPLQEDRTGWKMETPLEIEGLALRAWLPDPGLSPRVGQVAGVTVRREGAEHLLEFGRLPAGSSLEIEFS